jgi:hypothetical protein
MTPFSKRIPFQLIPLVDECRSYGLKVLIDETMTDHIVVRHTITSSKLIPLRGKYRFRQRGSYTKVEMNDLQRLT